MDSSAFEPLYAAHVDEIVRRYAEVLPRFGLDAVVLHSGKRRLRREFDDDYWPLVPLAPFAHFIALREPECLIVVRPGARPKLVRYLDDSFWEQPPDSNLPMGPLDVVEVRHPQAAREHIPMQRCAWVGAADGACAGLFPSEMVNPPSLVAALDATRVLKTPYEIACLAEANARAINGHKLVVDGFVNQDLSELQLHLVYLAGTAQDDPETPYKNIVATGANAATLHHVTYRRSSEPEPSTSLLLDAGATFRGYAADITRTHVRGPGEAADRFRALVSLMEAMQQRLCASVKIGLPYQELHDQSHRELASVMRDIGLSKLSADELVAAGITRAFYPHGLGHSLGIQTHDVGCAELKPRADNPFLRNTSTIAAGQVFTIEPGIYFIRSLLAPVNQGPLSAGIDWQVVELLWRFGGIRIEDDVHVTTAGIRNLTREAFSR
jgi:Xaa-Pro dipeptidase